MEASAVLTVVAKGAIAGISRGLVATLNKLVKTSQPNTEATIAPRLEQSLSAVLSWSERVQFWGLPAMDIDTASVALHISTTPRRFATKSRDNDWDEDKILLTPKHVLLIGDPGAGKSTTLKRLCRKLLLEGETHSDDHLQFPIVIRLRQAPLNESVYQWLAASLGLSWKEQEVKKDDDHAPNKTRILIGERELSEVVVEVLESARPLICIDGMDEVPSGRRERLELELAELAGKLRSARLIISTRSGDYVRAIDGVDVIELLPLTDGQIGEVSRNVLGDPDAFLASIRALPVYESLRRPIALMQTLVLYKTNGMLPDQPNVTARNLIDLYLEQWDFHNRLRRESQYANFSPIRKRDFLSAVAFHLMYRSGSQSFTFDRAALERIYADIHQSFGLPLSQASTVAQELETHTGILVQARLNAYEFSDVPTQEFLAASYIVHDPFTPRIFDHLSRYPGPVAIAIALARDSNEWMANIFLNRENQGRIHNITATLPEFLRRLRIERPYFYESGVLGYVVLLLVHSFSDSESILDALMEFLHMPSVQESTCKAIAAYLPSSSPSSGTKYVEATLRRLESLSESLFVPKSICVPTELWSLLTGSPAVEQNASG